MNNNIIFSVLAADATGKTPAEIFFNFLIYAYGNMADSFSTSISAIFQTDVVEDMSTITDVFTAAGSTLLTLFLCLETFAIVTNYDFNGGIEGAIRIAMKLVVCQLIVQNIPNIVGAVTGLFSTNTKDMLTEGLNEVSNTFKSVGEYEADFEPGVFGINYIPIDILMVLLLLVVFALYALILISVMQVTFETCVLVVIAPVPLSTLINSQARSTAIAFIKNYAAVCMQWGVLGAMFKVYSVLTPDFMSNFNLAATTGGGYGQVLMMYLTPVLSLVILAVMVTKAGDITKRALGG